MGYREDIEANFDITYPSITLAEAKLYLEDVYIQKALAKLLRVRRNQLQGIMLTARNEYALLHPEVAQEDIKVVDLGEINSQIPEWYRKLYSYEPGTLSGKIRDATDKVEQEIEKRVVLTIKGE